MAYDEWGEAVSDEESPVYACCRCGAGVTAATATWDEFAEGYLCDRCAKRIVSGSGRVDVNGDDHQGSS